MPGEQSRVGWANTALFRDIVKNFGWVQRGPIDENISCKKCGKLKNGNWKIHGVDALFTIKCPYLERNRAIIVDGKRYTMESVGGPARLNKWLRATYKTVMHARESLDILNVDRNLPSNALFDTAMVVWDCYKDWDKNKAKKWIKEVHLNSYANPPVIALLTTKDFLNRLQTLDQFRKTVIELQFLYIVDNAPTWSDVITPELLHSSILAVRVKDYNSDYWNYAAFYFDDSTPSNISFLVDYLAHSSMLIHESVKILIPCKMSEVEIYQTHLDSSFKDNDGFGEKTKFICEYIPTSNFAS